MPGPVALTPRTAYSAKQSHGTDMTHGATLGEPESRPEVLRLKLIEHQLKMREREALEISCRVKTGPAGDREEGCWNRTLN